MVKVRVGDKAQSYRFMLRLKVPCVASMWRDPRTLTLTLTVNPNPNPEPNPNQVPCGEIPGPLYAELDDISNKWGHGDLRATTRQAFQLHGVLKSNLKDVIKVGLRVGLG